MTAQQERIRLDPMLRPLPAWGILPSYLTKVLTSIKASCQRRFRATAHASKQFSMFPLSLRNLLRFS